MSDIVNSEQPIEEPLTKPKRPRTQKQMEAFEKVKEKRQQNIAVKKQQKLLESAKLLVETEKNKKEEAPKPKLQPQSKTTPQPKEEVLSEYTEAENTDEEVIVIKKAKSKPKKKVRKVIIESDSDSENESDQEYEHQQPVRVIRPNMNTDDFFC
jgi:hypothetical protein